MEQAFVRRYGASSGVGRAVMALTALILFVAAPFAPARACGPGGPLTSAEILEFQLGIIDRGLAREALTPDEKSRVIKLRADVEALQKAEKRDEAREVMKTIVAMFKTRESMGAVEPIVPGCLGPRATVVTGVLLAIDMEPNVPGARCGNHYVLSLKQGGGKGQVIKLSVYDVGKVSGEMLTSLLDKQVDVDTLGSGVTGLRLSGSQQAAGTAVSGLSPRSPC